METDTACGAPLPAISGLRMCELPGYFLLPLTWKHLSQYGIVSSKRAAIAPHPCSPNSVSPTPQSEFKKIKNMDKNLFFKHYANLPMNIREEVVLDLGEELGGPITWQVAYREIAAGTALGDQILGKLFELKFIPNE